MIIKTAEFVVSNTNHESCPADGKPEYAFIGRSNVGKSSLINMLVNRKALAMTSSTPGKTMLINHFLINDAWYLVDLPGYGYARRGKENREKLRVIIEDYILERAAMTTLFVLVDSRHAPQAIDLEFMEWLGESEIPFSVVFTKGDKQGTGKLRMNVKDYQTEMLKSWDELPPIFVTSSETGTGKEELLKYIEQLNKTVK